MADRAREQLVTLDRVEPEEEVDILPDFPAEVDGRMVWVTAVLSRTAVIEPSPGEPRVLVNRRDCLVDRDDIRYGTIAARAAAKRGREAARRNRTHPRRNRIA
ncbi:MAG: hypothetical protein J2P43_13310 [Candidatus Dormibacteraeota bacterium]|nr:hypothetical protein [Candidatus Dormibacteraeota bacterium]